MAAPSVMTRTFPTWTYNDNGLYNTDNVPVNDDFPPPWTSNEAMTISVVSYIRIALCILAMIANGLVLILQLKLKSFLQTYFVFALSLSIADAIYSLGVLLETYAFLQQHDMQLVLFLSSALATAGHLQTYLSVILVAVDRYLALCAFPLRYKTTVSLKKYYIISTICWCWSFAYGFMIRYLFPPGHYLGSLETFIIPTIAVIIYCAIYLKLYLSTSRAMQRSDLGRRIKQSKKLLVAVSIIVLTNFVLLMPSRAFNLYLSLQPTRFLYFGNVFWVNIFYNLQTFNSVVNPLIYWWQVLLKDISRCRRRKSRPSDYSKHVVSKIVVNRPIEKQDIELCATNFALVEDD